MSTSYSRSANKVRNKTSRENIVFLHTYRTTDSQLARDAFSTFIPISVDSDARSKIVFDFFDLLTAIAANGKSNGLGGRKLSRYAGWWAFEHTDTGNGFEAAYKSWARYVVNRISDN
jgi:hypothetical protein